MQKGGIAMRATRKGAAFGATIVGTLLLASCAQKHGGVPIPPPAAPPPQTGSTLPTQPDLEAIWHVRAALNVGALTCRGGYETLAADYNLLLDQHDALLSRAYAFEENRFAESELDRHLTQIYNRFANQHSPQGYCRAAQAILAQARAADATRFSMAAPEWLAVLEQALLSAPR